MKKGLVMEGGAMRGMFTAGVCDVLLENQVRRRAGLADISLSDFSSADKLFEQIANVERPKEFGCENGRGIDLIRWGFFYDEGRRNQLAQHTSYHFDDPDAGVSTAEETTATASDYSMKYYTPGHEYFMIAQSTMNNNQSLVGNSANNNSDNSSWYSGNGWSVHPVVDLD